MNRLVVFSSLLIFSLSLVYCGPGTKEAKNPEEQILDSLQTLRVSTDTVSTRFEEEIINFENLDKTNGYQKNCVLFTGSSSIRMWATLNDDMQNIASLNRGFGGATIPEVLHYADRYIFQHEPQIIVFYCGENDIADGASPTLVFSNFKLFAKLIESRLPNSKLIYISMKPSPARWDLWEKYKEGDNLIKEFIDQKPNFTFMNSSYSMLGVNGLPKKDIFIDDGLHMNAKGYAGWTRQLLPLLENIYKD